jgi:histidine ammonia-lyase
MISLRGRSLSLAEIARVALGHEPVELAPEAQPAIDASRRVVEENRRPPGSDLRRQHRFRETFRCPGSTRQTRAAAVNLVRSHSCGVGRPLSEAEVRSMMLLRSNVLTLGYSGIRLEVIELLLEMLNRRVWPVIPEKGSVGASGDLAPLAHLALALIGEGEAFYENTRCRAQMRWEKLACNRPICAPRKGLRFSMGRRRCMLWVVSRSGARSASRRWLMSQVP